MMDALRQRPVFFILSLFIASCAMIAAQVLLLHEQGFHISVPYDMHGLKNTSGVFAELVQHRPLQTFALFSSVYLVKQSFAVPGSSILNVLAGMLYGNWAFPLVSFLTACGATCCFGMSAFLGKHSLQPYLGRRIADINDKLLQHKDHLFSFLLFLRIFPFSPNWLLNVLSPLVGVPVKLFFLSVLFGLMPYNFVCSRIGAIIHDLDAETGIMDSNIVLNLVVIALVPLTITALKSKIATRFRS